MTNRLLNISPYLERIDGIQDGLNTLSNNMGLDIPDTVTDIIPCAGAIVASVRLIYGVSCSWR